MLSVSKVSLFSLQCFVAYVPTHTIEHMHVNCRKGKSSNFKERRTIACNQYLSKAKARIREKQRQEKEQQKTILVFLSVFLKFCNRREGKNDLFCVSLDGAYKSKHYKARHNFQECVSYEPSRLMKMSYRFLVQHFCCF